MKPNSHDLNLKEETEFLLQRRDTVIKIWRQCFPSEPIFNPFSHEWYLDEINIQRYGISYNVTQTIIIRSLSIPHPFSRASNIHNVVRFAERLIPYDLYFLAQYNLAQKSDFIHNPSRRRWNIVSKNTLTTLQDLTKDWNIHNRPIEALVYPIPGLDASTSSTIYDL